MRANIRTALGIILVLKATLDTSLGKFFFNNDQAKSLITEDFILWFFSLGGIAVGIIGAIIAIDGIVNREKG
jgi:hypothetical protein